MIMEQLDEYRVNLKVCNNLILSAIENSGYKSVNQFCKINKLCPSRVGDMINLKRLPVGKDGSWTGLSERIAKALGLFPEDLWTQEQTYFVLPKNQSHFNVSHKELALTLARHTGELPDECDVEVNLLQQDRKRVLNDVLESLTDREAKVLQLRFGINTDREHSLSEIASMLDVTSERVRQIELSALRRLREPRRLDELKTVEDPIPNVDFNKIKIAQDNAEGRTMDIKEYDKLCGEHDWTYAYADDYRYFTRGEQQRGILMDYAKRDEKLMRLFNVWANYVNGNIDKAEFQKGRAELLS
jgi:RNA polymerase sigma factor (sigma-70 family)